MSISPLNAILCQLGAIQAYAIAQSTGLNVTELSVLRDALAKAALDVECQAAFNLTFGSDDGRAV